MQERDPSAHHVVLAVRRRTALAGAAATLSIVLTACGASFNAQTSQPYQPAEGTNADSGSIAVRNALVLAADEGKGELYAVIVSSGATTTPWSASPGPAGDPPDGQAGDDRRSAVTFGNVKPARPEGQDLDGGAATPAAEAGAARQREPITVTGAKPGEIINVVLTFGEAAPITTYIPVLTIDHFSPAPRPDAEGGHG